MEREVNEAFAAASHLSIKREVEMEERARLGTTSVEALTPIELLEKYLESRQVDGERQQQLLAKAEEILNSTQ